MTSKGLPVILGGALIGSPKDGDIKITTTTLAQEYVNVFRKHGGTTIDTSRRYPAGAPGTSEEYLGQTDIATWATIDTKVLSDKGGHAPDQMKKSISESLASLKVKKVHLMYLHYPDRSQPLEAVVDSMAEAHKLGEFEHWAISNYSIDEVKQILKFCQDKGYPKPVAYQGHYNALTRKMEEKLLPVLRENGIAFYAYSPAAGGAFSQNSSRKQLTNWLGDFARSMYHSSDALTSAIVHVQTVAAAHDITGHEVALRWVQHHSALSPEFGDHLIVGASTAAQLDKTMTLLAKGPLPEEVAQAVDGVWESARATAPEYSPFLGDFPVVIDEK